MSEDVICVLDTTGPTCTPLDGKGELLPPNGILFWLPFTKAQVDAKTCANSRGELFDPQPEWTESAVQASRSFVGPDVVVG